MIRRIAISVRFATSAIVICPLATPAASATLPVPCAAGACAGASSFVGAGQATAVQAGSKLTVTQTSANTTLNWQSFNISADGKVQFVQPSASSVALNRIFQADPSKIFGGLQANGSVYLINRNGIVFGANAQVNVGSLVASTLDLKAVDANGALTGLTTPGLSGQAALQQFQDSNGLQLTSAPVTISNGATLQTTEGGQVLVFAPTITNEGTIRAPGGQTVLAAGSQIYLASTTDPNLRGLLVEVGGVGGTVTNGMASNANAASVNQLVGQITAERGNVTLAAHAVNQLGLVSATTSINENGSIRLQARDGGSQGGTSSTPIAGAGGVLTLGQHSVTEVTLDTADTSTTVDSVAQPKSGIALFGKTIDVLNNSVVRATGGTIEGTAEANQANPAFTGSSSDGSRFYVADGAVLDVSGANVTLPVGNNVIAVQLRGTELADDPLQRDGVLRGQTVYVDVRAHGTNADGSPWQGTPLANVTGEIAAITRGVSERNLDGGKISIQSQGDAILAPGSQLDVAGGSIQYTPGLLKTSNLLTATGQIVSISGADPSVSYSGILDSTAAVNAKWGVTGGTPSIVGTYATGYVEGKDAGSVSLVAPRFVFDGSVNGSVDAGMYQRLPTNSVQLPAAPAGLYRSYDEVPLGASLIIGQPNGASTDFVTGNLLFQSGAVLPGLHNADGSLFDPLQSAALPESYAASVLRPEIFGSGDFNAASLNANGQITEPAGTALRFSPGGNFSAAANVIDLQGSIDAPGGAISATAEATANPAPKGVSFMAGSQASFTARGGWVNDYLSALTGSSNDAPLYLGGGSISFSAINGNMSLATGSLIDVSGGAQLTAQGQVNSGSGGSMKISVSAPGQAYNFSGPPLELALGSTLRGYGVSKGGKLSLTARGVCIAAADCSGGDASVLWLTPDRFTSGGFGSYSITAQQGGLSVEPGTLLTLRQDNLRLPLNLTALPNSPTLLGFAVPTLLPDLLRKPVSLSLNVTLPATGNNGNNDILTVTPATPSLDVGAGASIIGDPGAALSLTSNSRVIVDGSLRAPSGNISLTLSASGSILESDYAPTQAIWLGTSGVLDVAGIAESAVGDTGLRTGSILSGGTVSLTASRGSIELLPGSLIDVSGATGTLDIAPIGGGPSRPQLVASAGGTVQLTAADSMVVGGMMRAGAGQAAPGNPQPQGGSLFITLDSTNVGDANVGQGTSTFPAQPRQIQVSSNLAPTVVGTGTAVPSVLDGFALVGADNIKMAGFDSLSLQAVPVLTASGMLPGSIEFIGDVSLTAARDITLDAAAYGVTAGSTAQIQAPYVSFGNSSQRSDIVAPSASSGTGTLNVSAGFLELYGVTTLQGVGNANFSSSGDMRLRGLTHNAILNTPVPLISGGLYASGSLDLTATQIYATTLSQFTIASDPTSGSITVDSAPGPLRDVLSAGSSLTLSANSIFQDGTLRAPLGEIALQGNSVQLGAGSLTSTSADGLTIPFGTTQGGFDWVYAIQAGLNTVYGTDGSAPPAQHVNLEGAKVDVQKGAVIDVSGGGDLQAYEWIPGVGGTQDVLSQATRPNQFAIVPRLNASVAPYDQSVSQGTQLQVGDAVYLSASRGLPAGTYLLMPARYALLPGAFLVTEVSGYQGIQSGQTFAAAGGGTIVSGYRTVIGTSFGDSVTSGFQVVPTSVVQQQAQYTTTSANQFFAQQSATSSAPVPRLPVDSGLLSLTPSESLSLNGMLLTTSGKGGIGAGVDISSAQILVATEAATITEPGQIVLTTDSLDQLGVQSLLLGGQRNGQDITTQAQSVVIDGGVNLTAPELMLAATDQVSVNDGASITARGTAPANATYALQGDGSFLRVSSGPQATVTRTGAAGSGGVLTLAAGSSITANQGSVYLDATSNVLAQGGFALSGGDLAVQSTHISVGSVPSDAPGTVLGANVFGVTGLRNLLLASSSSVDFYGSVALTAQNLTLDAAGLSGFGAAGEVASMAVGKTLILENSQGATASAPGAGTGTLRLSAADVAIGPGVFNVTGFDGVSLAAQNAVTGAAKGTLSTSGDFNVTASRITTSAGESLALDALGAVTLAAPATPSTPAADTDLGGSLSVTGSKIDLNTHLELPSGNVTLTTTGTGAGDDLVLGSAAAINVAGITRTYDGVTVASPGGSVTLASQDNVSLAAGSTIDVSPATGGSGGSLSIAARGATGTMTLDGTLTGQGSANQGSTFRIDAQNFGDFSALNRMLNIGGFSGERSVRLRGAGDLVVAAGAANAITAHQVSLEADQGSVIVQGTIDASGANGGSVLLAASNNVDVSGSIDAHATAAKGTGGKVELDVGTASGRLSLDAASEINVSGAKAGSVLLRVPRSSVSLLTSGGNGVALNGRILGSDKTTLEAFSVYQNLTGSISATDVLADSSNPIYQDAVGFMQGAGAIASALGRSSDASFVVAPGIEIQSTGDLALNTPWNLHAWTFNGTNGAQGVPGILTLRAAGALTINSQLSDGFASPTTFTLPTTASGSWSYRLVAGSDLAAANPLSFDPTTTADFTITAGSTGTGGGRGGSVASPHMVRTGDGFIDVATSGNFVLENQLSMLYTAGVASTVGIPVVSASSGRVPVLLAYPTDGGDIRISAGGDIEGALTNEFVNAWLWRVAGVASAPASSAVGWTVNFQNFQQGIGALGGGNVSVRAAGDIDELSVSIPSIGQQLGGKALADNLVDVIGGGVLSVQAGGSILGGSYYAGLGTVDLRAGSDIGPDSSAAGGIGLSPLIGLGDSSLAATARGNLQLSGIVNPTLFAAGALQGDQNYFSSYGAGARADLTAVGGNITLADESGALSAQLSASFAGSVLGPSGFADQGGAPLSIDVLPPTFNAHALNGDIDLGRVLVLSPAANGGLQMFADRNFIAAPLPGGVAQLFESDADPALLPDVAAPQQDLRNYKDIVQGLSVALADQHAATPIHSNDAAPQPVRIVARTGDIVFPAVNGGAQQSGIWSAVAAHIVAARDIVNLDLVAQNLRASDFTAVSAGRDIVYPLQRSAAGLVLPNVSEIAVDGPGQLQLEAGRDVNLGTSSGITTSGNLTNAALPAAGAAVSVEAGVGGGGPQLAAFIAKYIQGSSNFDADLIAFIADTTGAAGVSAAQAKQIFTNLGTDVQRGFVEQEFISLLRSSGRQAARLGNGDFTAAFAAIERLFPGANPNLAAGQINPYTGDIALYFSRIYTEQGGSVSLLAPGGEINVGLAAPPASFGIGKTADQLGLVAQSVGDVNAFAYKDFQVNQSRVFAADGGNILVWSTRGDIDAGRGSKTAISAPPPIITIDPNGRPVVAYRPALTGSGIQTLVSSPGVTPGDVDLFAPHGVVNANDAGIVAGNLTIAATAVLGTSNISVSGTTVGVPVAVTGLGANVAGAAGTSGSATSAAESAAGNRDQRSNTPAADTALGWLDVFVTGLGEDQCKPDDVECLKRQKAN